MHEEPKKFIQDISGLADPVVQDLDSCIFDIYRGESCRLVPVLDRYGRVEKWIPDPLETTIIDRDIENREKSIYKPDAVVVPTDSLICIDGSNVVGRDDKLRTKTLKAIVRALNDADYKVKVFVDRSIFGWLKHKMNDIEGSNYLSRCERDGIIIVAPSKAEADGQILQFAEFEKNAHIITNDKYRDYVQMHPWLEDGKRLHGINIVPMNDDKFRILIAGFNLDIIVEA